MAACHGVLPIPVAYLYVLFHISFSQFVVITLAFSDVVAATNGQTQAASLIVYASHNSWSVLGSQVAVCPYEGETLQAMVAYY